MDSSYQIVRIQRYLNGELSKEEMYQLERDALDDPFLQEALDGYHEANMVDHGQLSLLQQRLAARVAGQQTKRDSFFFGVQRLAIGATAFVLFITVCILFWMRTQMRSDTTSKEVEVELQAIGADAPVSIQSVSADGFDAIPVDGWGIYNEYLSVNTGSARYSGMVVMDFEVDTHGLPTHIVVEESPDDAMVNEAVRLLWQGPRWTGERGRVAFTFKE